MVATEPLSPNSAMNSSDPPDPGRRRSDRSLLLAVVLAAVVIIPRSVSIAVSHSEAFDDAFHYARGMIFLTGDASRSVVEDKLWFNDPPLGEALNALPIYLVNRLYGRPPTSIDFYAHPLGRESLAALVAVWKSILFLPLVAVVFAWTRDLYGPRAAWLATAMVTIEPNFAAHIPTGAVDSYGVEGVVISCYLAWRFYERPSIKRAAILGISSGITLMLKHIAVILPVIYAAYAGIAWVVRPWLEGQGWTGWTRLLRTRISLVGFIVVATFASLWAATLFDLATPLTSYPLKDTPGFRGLRELARRPMPAGIYFYSFIGGFNHSRDGHFCYLWGQKGTQGWWYYFPALLTYKVPLGIGLVIFMGVLSLRTTRPRWDDCAVLIPWVALTLLLMTSKINIGFRHYLAAYVFLLMFASRCLASAGPWRSVVAWLGVLGAAVHAASYHPDTMSYINFPRQKAYLEISDSNIDWGQSVKEIGQWLDRHPQPGRTVYLSYFGVDQGAFAHYLRGRVIVLPDEGLPEGPGLLFVSPCKLTLYDRFRRFRDLEPDQTIGHESMLLYDLDRPDVASALKPNPSGRQGP